MGELKRLDQPLLLQFVERTLAGRVNGALQGTQGSSVVVETLQPAHIASVLPACCMQF